MKVTNKDTEKSQQKQCTNKKKKTSADEFQKTVILQ